MHPSRKLSAIVHLSCRFWLLCCLALFAGAAWGQAQPDTSLADAQKLLDGAEDRLADVNKKLPATEAPEDFLKLNEQLASIQRDTQSAAQSLDAPLADVKARLEQLGAPPAAGTKESSDIANQRRDLTARQLKLDDARKRAELLGLDASQAATQLERIRSEKFSQDLTTRDASPLAPALWRQLAKAWPADATTLSGMARDASTTLRAAVSREGYGALVGGLIVALLLAFPVRIALRRLGRRLITSRGPGGRLRRSALAVWLMLVGTLSIGLAASAFAGALQAIEGIPESLLPLVEPFVQISYIAAFISALSGALMSRGQASWRLFTLDDATARRLLWHCHAAAWLAWLRFMAAQVLKVGQTSDILNQVLDATSALLYVALILSALATLTRSLRRTEHDPAMAGEAPEDSDPKAVTSTAKAPARNLTTRGGGVVALARILGYCAVLLALLAVLVGYFNFAVFVTRQIIWVALVWGAIALLLAFVDDLCMWMVRPGNRLSRALVGIGLRPSLLAQAGALVSAVIRVCLLVSGVTALLMPYGSNLSLFGNLFSALSTGLKLGNVRFAPTEILGALATLAIGWVLLQGAQQWLNKTYLPKTDLDVGARASVSAVVRYVGIVVVILWALAALGITAANLALVASALSVGIGFGLQAITQNFISGLILMAERPVRVGDWIRLGDQEGDVKRINVRATEIQIGDRSTLIVPNSELITKSVRNMTLSNPMGRVQLQFAVPLGTDMARVRELLLALYASHPKVLATPAPAVYIDAIANGQANFNSFLYVGSPRDAYSVRSELFFGLLAKMAEAGIALSSPQDIRVVPAPAQASSGPGHEEARSDSAE
ncbi:hypothetical protein ARC20_16205 [Stenotrophomonas panacihumi]|uniref:Uncharacterized protein n=1 Tax=Stenotrophomonas panacihumi TaxID=676599 RepID=A0A0R0A8X3_9GAMM|nr:DUF3772 domain-containing protein [Stenotrophomonas panacihumi]KRG37767.1 hypothetical protein ARC20_16205 [Stenotrophomonas panacihumi]PTN56291.1 DUF3772 domain-containing protein [Stenotrophomonas panacihumi]